MSIRDTIGGAIKEAQDGGLDIPGAKAGSPSAAKPEGKVAEGKEEPRRGAVPRSASRAKPARELRGSVRTEAARSVEKRSTGTKAERKAERERERDHEDLLMAASRALQKRDKEYARTERVWWVLMGLGLGFTLLSLALNYLIYPEGAGGLFQQVVSIVTLVAAYGFIVGAFIYDIAKRGKIRKRCDAEARTMSDRKIRQVLEQDMAEDARRRAERKAAREAKKAARGQRASK